MPEKLPESASLARMLQDLGTTPDEVAKALQTKGIKGVRNTARYLNPVVRYAQSQVTVDALGLDVMKGDTLRLVFHHQKKEEVPLPVAVRQFLDAFNEGKYPDLEMALEQGSSI